MLTHGNTVAVGQEALLVARLRVMVEQADGGGVAPSWMERWAWCHSKKKTVASGLWPWADEAEAQRGKNRAWQGGSGAHGGRRCGGGAWHDVMLFGGRRCLGKGNSSGLG